MQVGHSAQGLAIGITYVCATRKRVIVVGRRLENQPLELPAVRQVEQLRIDHVVVAHLVPGDVVKAFLRVGIGIVSVLVGVALGFHPKRAILIEELDVHRLVTIPRAILQARAAHAHHSNGVLVVAKEVRIGFHKAGRQHPGRVHCHGADDRGLEKGNGHRIGQPGHRRLVAIEGVVDVHPRRSADVQ